MSEPHRLSSIMTSSMEKIRELVDVNTIIGDSITTPDGVTVIPISKVSFGFASGGADLPSKTAKKAGDSLTSAASSKEEKTSDSGFGGGAGAGVTIKPEAFIVIKPDGDVKLLQMGAQTTALEGIVGKAPEIISGFKNIFSKGDGENSNIENSENKTEESDEKKSDKKKRSFFSKKN